MQCDYETIKQTFDWVHDADGYCIEYHVTYNAPSWSTGKWFNIEGLTKNGSLVDLLSIGYSYDSRYNWLVEGIYTL